MQFEQSLLKYIWRKIGKDRAGRKGEGGRCCCVAHSDPCDCVSASLPCIILSDQSSPGVALKDLGWEPKGSRFKSITSHHHCTLEQGICQLKWLLAPLTYIKLTNLVIYCLGSRWTFCQYFCSYIIPGNRRENITCKCCCLERKEMCISRIICLCLETDKH